MANIFKRFTEIVNKPNRAPYDLSFQNNVTMKFGTLYPVFCKEVLPGDSFRIKPTFGFNFMPLVSPVQTRMRAHLHFFYVRNRPHWKDFMDWDGMTKEGLTPPYLSINESNRDMINTGSIGDFLGLPSKVYGLTRKTGELDGFSQKAPNLSAGTYDSSKYLAFSASKLPSAGLKWSDVALSSSSASGQIAMSKFTTVAQMHGDYTDLIGELEVTWSNLGDLVPTKLGMAVVNKTSGLITYVDEIDAGLTGKFQFNFNTAGWPDEDEEFLLVLWNNIYWSSNKTDMQVSTAVLLEILDGVDVSELELDEIPWANGEIRINAFPFRAYESIYNSFYRDDRNNPRIVNGQPEYNKFITTDEGGADTTRYQLYNRNWEPDFLTTAVQSPQQGVAPLVGITSVNAVGDITLTDSNGTEYTAKTTLAEDGDTIVGINITSGNGTSSVNRALIDMASTGISISDLRNVNALQRWLEINMRRGLRYRDQVMSHYGVDIEYKELNMPEFIGGVAEDVIVNRISQTTETEDNPLGSLAGQAGVIGTSKHDISHYCDEKGYIIGILSIAPVPNYSQILPKHLIKSSQLDYFTPEFAHIGMQPILYSEVTPLQASFEGKLNDVFGYQRPWYDYLASVDEVHGQFRDTLRRYLINRVYNGTPELGSEFLTIDSNQINDVFAVTDNTDKIYGQVYFDVTAKRPIAANVTPRIEP